MSTIKITDAGPVKRLEIPIEPGMITLLRAPNNRRSKTSSGRSQGHAGGIVLG